MPRVRLTDRHARAFVPIAVLLLLVGLPLAVWLDIRNITSPSYADTQALIDAIKNNIAAMYAGGGGGGGVTSVNGDTGSTGGTAAPSYAKNRYGSSPTRNTLKSCLRFL